MAGPVRLNTDWMLRLPTVVRPGLFDALSFEDTESALARLLGGLPAAGAGHVVTGPGGAHEARPGDPPPVRFGSPRPNRTGPGHPGPRHEPAAHEDREPSAPEYPKWTPAPVTRLARGGAGLSEVLLGDSGAPEPDHAADATQPSTMDRTLRLAPDREPEPERQVPTDVDHQEPGGPGPDHAGPARLGATAASGGTWPGQEPGDLPGDVAGDVLERLLDLVELDLHRTYGLGEW